MGSSFLGCLSKRVLKVVVTLTGKSQSELCLVSSVGDPVAKRWFELKRCDQVMNGFLVRLVNWP